ncbi:hypothetical protein [Aestuariicoccus sp. MJ-SS9]|uniref:hypothetical protein n=1 Tax=Aestuariicoccus sp. MJ-SS9 TaxID=3079855 RepID=UPI002910A7C4|nr:hypothetical protein [Aestuariicoccus sp. MJ-SS9]MDU8911624.1 hypothetical protein [Aestuariicoccus sp. MJ-SS9]
MSVTLGPSHTVGDIRFAVLSRSAVTSLPFPQGAVVHGAKTPLYVLFRCGTRLWAQSATGGEVPIAEIEARYPGQCAVFMADA